MSILFWLRKNRKNKKGQSPVWCTISINQLKTEFSCKISIPEKDWDQVKQSVEGKNSDYYNSQLELITYKLLQIKAKFDLSDKPYSPKDLKETLLGKKDANLTFLDQFDQFVEEKKTKNPDIRTDSIKKYTTLRKNYVNFLKYKGQLSLLPEEFSTQLMDSFELFLFSNLKQCSKNHATRHLEGIKAVQRYCLRAGKAYNPQATEYVTKRVRNKKIVYLKRHEIEKLNCYNFGSDKLKCIADLFLFQCWTGFAYVDLFRFNHSTDMETIKGKQWIIKERKKTDTFPQLPLFPMAEVILIKYNYQLPYFSNKDYNLYLKVIGGCLNLKFNLTTHVARKTAGTLWLNEGVSLDVVGKMLGHKKVQTTKDMYAFLEIDRVERETRIFFETKIEADISN